MVRLLKPSWVSHNGGAIYTSDIQPNGVRMATGGMCNSGGIICIWNMLPIRNENCEKDPTVPKKLCQMDNHISCVNCVRFSPNGKWLASSGDDAVIMIWYLVKRGAPTTVFGSNTEYAESWRIHTQLKGHQGDILHLAWSSHSAWLASASVDNTVLVWNVSRHPPQQMAVLRGHAGMVKGITWDPAGKYLASQSDDRTVRIWRTSDWKEEIKVKSPFKKSTGTTHVLRLDWSPDGSTVVAPHAINSGFPTAQIIFRHGWKPSLDFVGHRQAITCARFNSNVFSKKFSEGGKPQNVLCVALGCKDRSLSVWMTPRRRPLLVLHDLFAGSIMDLSWSQCGMELLCCSLDGTVAFLQFNRKEMGAPLSKKELATLHRDTYGQSLLIEEDAAAIKVGGLREENSAAPEGLLAESAEMLALQREQRKLQEAAQATDKAASKTEPQLPRGPAEQIESRTEGGCRRITPKFLGDLHGEAAEEEAVAGNAAAAVPAEAVRKETPKVAETEKKEAEVERKSRKRKLSTEEEKKKKKKSRVLESSAEEENASEERRSSEGSESEESDSSELSSSSANTASASESRPERKRKEAKAELKAKEKKKQKKKAAKKSSVKQLRRRRILLDSESEEENEESDEEEEEEEEEEVKPREKAREKKNRERTKEKATGSRRPSLAGASLPTGQASLGLGGDRSVQIDAVSVRSRTAGTLKLHRLSIFDARLNQRITEVLLAEQPVAMATTKEHVCLCDARGRLHIWSPQGSRICPPLRLDAPCVSMTTLGSRLLLVTCDYAVHLWSLSPSIRLLHRASFANLVSDDAPYRSCQLGPDDTIVISLTDGSAFAFSPQVNVWMELADSTDPVRYTSRLFYKDSQPSGALALATSQPSGPTSARSSQFLAACPSGQEEVVRQTAVEDYLETQLSSALLLRSADEARAWTLAYARHIIVTGREEKVRRLCEDLLGPAHGDAGSQSGWEDNILGHPKRAILRDILPSFGLNLKLQRLYSEIKDVFDLVES